MIRRYVETSITRAGYEALNLGIERHHNVCWEGAAGIGKSSLSAWAPERLAQRNFPTMHLRFCSHETPREALHALWAASENLDRATDAPVHQTSRLFWLVRQNLYRAPDERPVIVFCDEADYLEKGTVLHTLRDLHDLTNTIFVFLSITTLAHRLSVPSVGLDAAVASRTVQVSLPRPSQADAQRLADELLENLTLAPDLVAHALKSARGSVRGLIATYGEIEKIAHAAGLRRLDLARWVEIDALARGGLKSAPRMQTKGVAATSSEGKTAAA